MLDIHIHSDIGGRTSQQDVVAMLQTSAGDPCGVALSDGTGGLADGDKAAQSTCDTCQSAIARSSPCDLGADPVRIMTEAIAASQKCVQSLESEYCATTLTMAVVVPPYVYVAWVGDSPAWLYSRRQLIRISSSHGLPQEQWRNHQITSRQVADHPESNVITRAINKGNGLWSPDMRVIRVKSGDRLILASDGLDAVLRDYEIEKILQNQESNLSSKVIAQSLIHAALARNTPDNVSVGVIRVLDPIHHVGANDLVSFQRWKDEEFAQGKELFRSIAIYSEKGHEGLHHWPGLVLDIDCEDDVETARRVSVEIVETVTRICGLDPAQVRVAFSGSKGFHLVLPGELFGPEGNRQSCRFWKFVAHRLRETYPQICPMIYSAAALLRLSGSVNYKSGLYKIPLEFAELRDLSASDITAMAKSPRHEDVWVVPEYEQRAERWLEQQIEAFRNNVSCSASHLSSVLSANNGWVGAY